MIALGRSVRNLDFVRLARRAPGRDGVTLGKRLFDVETMRSTRIFERFFSWYAQGCFNTLRATLLGVFLKCLFFGGFASYFPLATYLP